MYHFNGIDNPHTYGIPMVSFNGYIYIYILYYIIYIYNMSPAPGPLRPPPMVWPNLHYLLPRLPLARMKKDE